MAEAALFVGWGSPIPGREAKGLEVFNEALAYQGDRQQAGEIESFEVAFLTPHGGELSGFILIRGSEDQIGALLRREDFLRINTRAAMVVEGFGVVPAVLGEELGRQISIYQEAIAEMEQATA
jgi:hypothetical protein